MHVDLTTLIQCICLLIPLLKLSKRDLHFSFLTECPDHIKDADLSYKRCRFINYTINHADNLYITMNYTIYILSVLTLISVY